LIESVDCHVEQQGMPHAVLKGPEMGADEKGTVQGGERPDRSVFQQSGEGSDSRSESPILHDRIDSVCLSGGFNHAAGVFNRVGHGFFAEHMASPFQGGHRHGGMGGGYGAIENEVRPNDVQHGVEVLAHGNVLELETIAPSFGVFASHIHQPDQIQVGTAQRVGEPLLHNMAATDADDLDPVGHVRHSMAMPACRALPRI